MKTGYARFFEILLETNPPPPKKRKKPKLLGNIF